MPKGEFPLKPRQSPNTMTDSNGNVNKFEAPSALAGSKKQQNRRQYGSRNK